MVTFDATATRHDGVTLVVAHLREIDEPTRVTVRNRLDGPVWPPRREGVPAAGWSESGFEGVVGPADCALGYATPAQPAEQPAVLDDVTPAPEADTVGSRTESVADVVRELGDPSPPGDAVPSGPVLPAEDADDEASGPGRITASDESGTPSEERLPAAAEPWIEAMASRVELAERLADAETLPAATAAVRETGGLAEVRALAEDAETDERRLRALARRAETLADRRAAASVPVETLARLA